MVYNGEVAESEKINFKKSQSFKHCHCILCGNLSVTRIERNVKVNRLFCDNNACCVGRYISWHTLDAHGNIKKLSYLHISLIKGTKLRYILYGIFKWLTSWYFLCKHISCLIRQTHCSCHISHCLLCRKRAKGRYLCNVVRAVFLHNVINNTLSAFHAEIYIKVRHGNSFGIEKTFKKQIIFQRVYTRYAYAISTQTSCT